MRCGGDQREKVERNERQRAQAIYGYHYSIILDLASDVVMTSASSYELLI